MLSYLRLDEFTTMIRMWRQLLMSTSWRTTSVYQMSLTTSNSITVCPSSRQLNNTNGSRCTIMVFRAEISWSVRKFHRQADRFLFISTINSSMKHYPSINSREDSCSLLARLARRKGVTWLQRVLTSIHVSFSSRTSPRINQMARLGRPRWPNRVIRDHLLVAHYNQLWLLRSEWQLIIQRRLREIRWRCTSKVWNHSSSSFSSVIEPKTPALVAIVIRWAKRSFSCLRAMMLYETPLVQNRPLMA